jgi:hypothetical protein
MTAPPPPGLGPVEHSPEAAELMGSIARHLMGVLRHRTLWPAQQVQVLLLVAANIATDLPQDQVDAACTWFCQDAALRWHHAVSWRHGLASMPPVGSA